MGMKKAKRYCIFALVMLGLMTFSGCGEKEKTKEEILADIISQDDVFQNYSDLTVTSFEITDRRTDKKEKIDTIYFQIEAENEDIAYELNGESNYYLYEQGWKLEYVSEKEKSIVPLRSTITQEMADATAQALIADYSDWELILTDRATILDYGQDTFFYTIKDNSTPYYTYEYSLKILYSFDEMEGWNYNSYDISELCGYWNEEKLCGTWRTDNVGYTGYFEISIYDINNNEGTADVSYICDFDTYWSVGPVEQAEYGQMKFDIDDWTYVVKRTTMETFEVKLDRHRGVIFDGYYCSQTRNYDVARGTNFIKNPDELPVIGNTAYEEMFKVLANYENDVSKVQEMILSEEYEKMCSEFLNTISEDCILYEENNIKIILHHVNVPEDDVLTPCQDYVLWVYNSEVQEGAILAKCIWREVRGAYVAVAQWEEVTDGIGSGYKTGYCPNGNAIARVLFEDGTSSTMQGPISKGVWDHYAIRKYSLINGSYGDYSMCFYKGFLQNALGTEKNSIVCTWHDFVPEEKTYETGEKTKNQEKAYGILGFGEAFF